MNVATIRQALELLHPNGDVVEVRFTTPDHPVRVGYFDDLEKLARVIFPWDGRGMIQATLNPLNPDLKARSLNRLTSLDLSTFDADVLARRWFALSMQSMVEDHGDGPKSRVPVQSPGEVIAFLTSAGWPRPITATAGREIHAFWRIDLPNDDATRLSFESVLDALNQRFPDGLVWIDRDVVSARWMIPVYGTLAGGDRTAILDIPQQLGMLTTEHIRSILPSTTSVTWRKLLRPVKALDFLRLTTESLRWTWEPFFPEGRLCLLAAYMKTGKSTFIYALAIAVSRGMPFLGYPTTQGRVLILAVEEHPDDVRRRLTKFGLQPDDPIWIHSVPLRTSPEALQELRVFILENQIKLVLIDTLARFWTVNDENSNSEVERQISPLLELSRAADVTIVLIHHESKSGGDDGRGIRGASALLALVDQALILDRRQGGNGADRVLTAIGRYAEETPSPLVITLDGSTYRSLGALGDLDIESRQRRVWDAVDDEPRTREQICEATGLTYKAVNRALTALGDRIIREGEGKKGEPYTYRRQPDVGHSKRLGAGAQP